MSQEANSGTGVNLSSTYFMRNFYSDNRAAFASETRGDYSKTQLSKEDSKALRRAIKKLGTYSFDDTDSTNVRSTVKALVQTYNNLLSSGTDSSDQDVSRNTKKLKSLMEEYSDALDKVGITVNEDSTLTIRDDLFANADISKFQDLFSSESEFTQQLEKYAKNINRYSDTALEIEKNNASAAANKNKTTSLEELCNTGIGRQINFVV